MTDTGRTSSTRGAAAKSKQADRRARQARQGGGIDDPAPRRGLRLRNPLSGDMFGRGAEAFARFMGTPAFLVGMTVFCAVWLGWNTFMPESIQFDPRALNFTLLTLILSLQASYAAPLLLLSDNRQADRDRVQAEQDRQSTERNHATTDFITREIATLRLALNEVATRDFVRGELRDLLPAQPLGAAALTPVVAFADNVYTSWYHLDPQWRALMIVVPLLMALAVVRGWYLVAVPGLAALPWTFSVNLHALWQQEGGAWKLLPMAGLTVVAAVALVLVGRRRGPAGPGGRQLA